MLYNSPEKLLLSRFDLQEFEPSSAVRLRRGSHPHQNLGSEVDLEDDLLTLG